MSIINDALKKAKQAGKESPGEAAGEKADLLKERYPAGQEPEKPKDKKIIKIASASADKRSLPAKPAYIAALLIAAAAVAFFFFYRGTAGNSLNPVKSETAINSPVAVLAKNITASPRAGLSKKSPSGADGFTLTGVIHGEGEPMAIISGSVYMKGDFANGAEVIDIKENSVILNNNGKEIELRVE